MLVHLLSRLISGIKHREYVVDSSISDGILLGIAWDRALMLLRGLWHQLFLRRGHGVLFIGRKVKIRAHRCIDIQSGATIEDGCYINGLSKGGVHIGQNFSIGRNGVIECTGVIREVGESLVIGNNVGIAANAFISVRGPVSIGDNTIFGPGVRLFAENHVFSDLETPVFMQDATRKGVKIGEDCWLGAGVTILDGVEIGNKVVVAAGAVVTKDIPDLAIAGGIPAKVLKTRLQADAEGKQVL